MSIDCCFQKTLVKTRHDERSTGSACGDRLSNDVRCQAAKSNTFFRSVRVIRQTGSRFIGSFCMYCPSRPETKVLVLALSFASAIAVHMARVANAAEPDPYETYIKTSRDFERVKQDKAWCHRAFPGWLNMPWTAEWGIGYTEASGEWCVKHGYNGAFLDRGNPGNDQSKTGKLDWITQFKLRFYVDHVADKGYLHLWDGDRVQPHLDLLHGGGVRTNPLNEALATKLQGYIRNHTNEVKSSPWRAAYALDDEISWGHFTHPTMWCVTDDKSAYQNWLREIYGPQVPDRSKWITYDEILPKLRNWNIAEFDASPLMDQWTFNDSYWNNFVGDLVRFTNSVDQETPCGFVGGQAPNAFGGFDYAKVMRKVQFIEAYNIASSQSMIRSFNPHNAIPAVTSLFHKSAADDIWQTWYYLAHGNRGFIGWVEGWFDGDRPKPWHDEVAATFLEASSRIGPLVADAEWQHDGIAIYYSHSAIQLGWILDAEAHGKTWRNRNGDHRLGASHHVRHAWENMLRDSGLQYNFLSYVDVVQGGIPSDYKVLILPACLCLSNAEARQIETFCRNGGTVIADYLPGVWDQHGKGRKGGGALDRMFGVTHKATMRSADLFGGTLWCEVDQDANFDWKSSREFLTRQNSCIKDKSGYHKVVRSMPVDQTRKNGRGTAILMNLSPQWYNAYRTEGSIAAEKRTVFMRHLHNAGLNRWVELRSDGDRQFGCELTYWTVRDPSGTAKGSRTVLFVCMNPEIEANEVGGGNAIQLKTDSLNGVLHFTHDVHDLRNERTGQSMGNGSDFEIVWKQNEAVVVSFARSED